MVDSDSHMVNNKAARRSRRCANEGRMSGDLRGDMVSIWVAMDLFLGGSSHIMTG